MPSNSRLLRCALQRLADTMLLSSVQPATAADSTPRFQATRESLEQYECPEWFRDAKFGIFVSWGVYAVPAFENEWYGHHMYCPVHVNGDGTKSSRKSDTYKYHVEHFGPPSEFGYKDFIPKFTAEKWDPEAWIDLFDKAGAKYVVPIAEHHDSFAMYDSSVTEYDTVNMGPKRDILGELAKAARKRGMKVGASVHSAFTWRWWYYEDGLDTVDPRYEDLYLKPHKWSDPASPEFLDRWYARCADIIDKYQPDILWFDFGFSWPEFAETRYKVAAYYYNRADAWSKEKPDAGVCLQYKRWTPDKETEVAFPDGAAVLDLEREKLPRIRKLPWQTDTSIGKKSWGYVKNWQSKTSDDLIDDLVDIVSKNGCLLLNIGPKADGTIPEDQTKVLLEIGAWLTVNGEAIYGTRPWRVYGEGPTEIAEGHMSEGKNKSLTDEDIRFTTKDGVLYAACMAVPDDGTVEIRTLRSGSEVCPEEITSVELLGSDATLDFDRTDKALVIRLPETLPNENALVFRIRLGEKASAEAKVLRAGAAQVDITPRKWPVIVSGGILERRVSKAIDKLHAKALVLDNGETRLAMAVVDSCIIPRELTDKAKELITKATGIPASNILISSTHTHTAPSVCGVLGSGRDEDYAAWLPGQIAESIIEANKRLQPAKIGWAVGKDEKNVFCRRYLMKPGKAPNVAFTGHDDNQARMNPGFQNPDAVRRTGPRDPAIPVVSVQTADGKPIAVLANYSTHYAGSSHVSADYFGIFGNKIGELLGAGPGFVGMMTNGTSGDANCLDFDNPPRKFTYVTVGEDTANAAYEACKGMKYHTWVPLAMIAKEMAVAIRKPTKEETQEAQAYLDENMKSGIPKNITEVYARETVLLSKTPPTRDLIVQAIRIGDVGIIALPTETYASTGLRIKEHSPFPVTFTIDLANGYNGYLPPPEQHELGGYTTWRARSSCLEVGAEPKMAGAAMELLTELAKDPRPNSSPDVKDPAN